jgi:hypothetical protein
MFIDPKISRRTLKLRRSEIFELMRNLLGSPRAEDPEIRAINIWPLCGQSEL